MRLESGVSLRHRYELDSLREWLCAGFAFSATILRPPPFAAPSSAKDYTAVADEQPDEALMMLDPLLGNGYRWLLAPNLLLAALVMLRVARKNRRCGIRGTRAMLWVFTALVAGAFALPVMLVLEPKRAWGRPVRKAPPAPLVKAA